MNIKGEPLEFSIIHYFHFICTSSDWSKFVFIDTRDAARKES